MSQKRILVAEDDANIRSGLVDALESEGYRVDAAPNGAQADALLRQARYDLALLDVMMPGKDGYAICQELRQRDSAIAILMVTAKGEEIDKVLGLKLGADDYIAKPFGLHELLARVEALLRRAALGARQSPGPDSDLPDALRFGALCASRRAYELSANGKSVALTPRELKLLEQFHAQPDAVLSRNDLLDAAWGVDYYGTTRTLDQHIAQLRKKAASLGAPDFLETVHGVGYRWRRR